MNATDQLIDMCPCPLLALDEDARIVSSNRAWLELAAHNDALLIALRSLFGTNETGVLSKELRWGQSWFKVTANLANPDRRLFALTEISELKAREAAALHTSLYDPLTQVYNRHAFYEFMGKLRAEPSTALIFIDLDRFKHVNDTYGHDVGDEVLKHTASRLKNLLKEADAMARWGGDEFVVCLPQATDSEASHIKKRLLSVFDEPYVVDGVSLKLSASIGATVVKLGEVTLEEALKQADTQMYKNKKSVKPPASLSRTSRKGSTVQEGLNSYA